MRQTYKASQVQGLVSATACMATLRLPLGPRYHSLHFVLSGTFVLADITAIRVKLNGQIIRNISATNLDLMNQYNGMPAYGASRVLTVYFDRNMFNQSDSEITAIDCGLVSGTAPANYVTVGAQDFFVELDVGAGTTNPVLVSYYEASESLGLGIGAIIIENSGNETYTGANGDAIIDKISRDNVGHQYIDGIYMFQTGIVTDIKVDRNYLRVFDRSVVVNKYVQSQSVAMRVPQTGLEVIDFTEKGYANNVLTVRPADGIQDLRLHLTISGAGPVPYITRFIGRLAA